MWQGACSPLDFPLAALPAFIGTIRPSDCAIPRLISFSHSHIIPEYQEGIGSPQVICRHCETWLALRHRHSVYTLAIRVCTCCLPPEGRRRPAGHVDFGAQSLSALFPNCLHLRSIVAFASPKLATNDAATSCWMRFPLINLHTLLGVPFIPPVHNQGVSLAPCRVMPYGKYSCQLLAHSILTSTAIVFGSLRSFLLGLLSSSSFDFFT